MKALLMPNSQYNTSYREDWETPQDLFDKLNKEFNFTLDAAADHFNNKVCDFITKEQNSLHCRWDGRVWCNPPYGRAIGEWLKHATHEFIFNNECELIVMLLPARTDTKWFHAYCIQHEIRFLKGRIKFKGAKYNAPFPSMLVIIRYEHPHLIDNRAI